MPNSTTHKTGTHTHTDTHAQTCVHKHHAHTHIRRNEGLTQVGDEVKVDGLVCETGEFIAEAEVVLSCLFNVERNGVILFALLVVHDLTTGREEPQINIKISPSDYLKKTTYMTHAHTVEAEK